jgi:hypothetical protein
MLSNYHFKVPNKQDLLMDRLTDFFQEKNNIKVLIPIINGNSNISLRIIDWFVTNYSKKKNTCIVSKNTEIKNDIKQFIVFLNYKSQLKAYTKKQFDPFCRRDRIKFMYDIDNNENVIETTVGQLNFFRWAIKHQIINYINENLSEIEYDMNISIRKMYNTDNILIGNRRKRQELSVSATKTINKHDINITLSFD